MTKSHRFVKVYVDDTPTTAMWSWESLALFPHLLRICFPDGQIRYGKRPLESVVSAMTRLPAHVVSPALVELDADGTIDVADEVLSIPNFKSYHFNRRSVSKATEQKDSVRQPNETGRFCNEGDNVAQRNASMLPENECEDGVIVSEHTKGDNECQIPSSSLSLSVSCSDPSREARDRRIWADVELVRERITWIKPPSGLPMLSCPPDRVANVLRTGVTVDEIATVVEALRNAVESGARPADQWRATYVFSGWYDKLRVELLSERQDF